MSNIPSDSACTFCCVAILTSLQQWCDTHALGANCKCCCGPRGCCDSCFESALNEDNFETQLKEDAERREAAAGRLFDTQPAPTEGMKASQTQTNLGNSPLPRCFA
ncbi:uncharacterized protein EDB93DRAFT_285071 [Suillus bovinus]|uniref:uncharacterized protein n=1 Tax=Suillus bovinus TaxID=48563 RepID=UPI001B861FE5|nr:uncharacterized protein EDB93DRAFT_285071 [Suillus bovinus]KAG2159398.1 hypothetical protein EDB93DRAFT_285071 [Suillus bovinus]